VLLYAVTAVQLCHCQHRKHLLLQTETINLRLVMNIFCSHVVLSILVGISHSFGETLLTGLQTNLKMDETHPNEISVYLF